ncbi:MAG: Bax inhibitor-1/YccA family protein [Chloroflexi bacterium]|nr:MAG: Bax inhibitor-1/YccA family protein [Chloroflexota bacterium]
MRNLVPQRSGNPVLRGNTFEGLSTTGERMTIDGTVNRSFALVAILLVGAGISIITSPGLAILGAVVGFVLALVTVFKKEWSPVTAPLYALAEGVFLGGFSVIFEAEYPGIVIPAVSLTVAIFIAFLLIYRTHLIRVTDKLRIGIVAATGGVVLLYLADLVLNLVGVHVSYLNEAVAGSGLLGIAVNVLVIGIAAFNLLLDFDFIERGVAAAAPKYMEWYAAFGLLVTLVWLYVEVLRLLARARRR